MRSFLSKTLAQIPILILIGGNLFAQDQDGVSFSRDVRPILSQNCFKCHGPDDGKDDSGKSLRKSGLRLDIADDQDWEEVIARITTSDPDEIMPPPETNKSLEPAQIDLLKRWISQGAKYEKHWSFVLPKKSGIPDEAHPIDHLFHQKIAKRADPYTLVRRLHLDLTGLPPSVEVADKFAANPTSESWKKLVDDLLKSPRYGERWARRWLDLARYADTNGYEKDRDRSIWPYRDYVIRSLNEDKPFDQFTIEQLAGDMLENPTTDQIIATGFHRNTMLNEEGGIDPLEFRYHAMTDRVATTGTTWLGLTTGCAQCHTHKYDPITHHDYFGLMAYLDNTNEPDFFIPDAKLEKQTRENLKSADKLEAELTSLYPDDHDLQDDYQAWLATQKPNLVDWKHLSPTKTEATTPYLTVEENGVIFAAGDVQKLDTYTLEFPAGISPISNLQLEALPDDRLPGGGPGMTYYEGRKGDFFLSEIEITSDKKHGIRSSSQARDGDPFAETNPSINLSHDGDIQTGWKPDDKTGIRHLAVFNLAEAIPENTSFTVTLTFSRHYPVPLGKLRLSAASEPEVKAIAHRGEMKDFLLQAPELKEQSDQIRKLRKPTKGTSTLVMSERPVGRVRPTHLRHRGEYTQPKERVEPRLPAAIYPDDRPYPKDRLGFARWLVSTQNPLTARVVTNRHWAAFFGEGIVPTLDDFGMQGKLPTNQKLLDHLAVSFMESGWSLKKLHRLIVTSDVYQQSSKIESGTSKQFTRQRLEAEIIRDAALQASGLLSPKMFGPPVRPPQPAGISEVAYRNPKWNASKGEDRFRRSIYTYQKRTAPFAFLTTFDATSGEACIARRDRSNTPLQALTLMNDPMFIEISESFGKSLDEMEGTVEEKLTIAFRRLLTRPPNPDEVRLLSEFHQKHPSWTALARALLSLDESVTKP